MCKGGRVRIKLKKRQLREEVVLKSPRVTRDEDDDDYNDARLRRRRYEDSSFLLDLSDLTVSGCGQKTISFSEKHDAVCC